MRHPLYLFLVLVAVLQVCWLGENWMWTTATLLVAEALRPERQHGEVGGNGDAPDHAQRGEHPGQ